MNILLKNGGVAHYRAQLGRPRQHERMINKRVSDYYPNVH